MPKFSCVIGASAFIYTITVDYYSEALKFVNLFSWMCYFLELPNRFLKFFHIIHKLTDAVGQYSDLN